ncbi:MAG: choice-of-anchor X domain-containing protein [Wenzhouxiangellaceae bacterium]
MPVRRLATLNFSTACAICIALGGQALAQDPKPGEAGWTEPEISSLSTNRVGSSPFNPPEITDTTFVVDDDAGLDTGCVFSSHGSLRFTIEIDRYIGDKDELIANGLLNDTAKLFMPVWDVDFNVPGLPPEFEPERNRVLFNGNVVPGEFLTGANNTWAPNDFEIPIQWVEFPDSPGTNGGPDGARNEIEIFIDVANDGDVWCVEVDWASLEIEAARPVVMAHGILSDGSTWDFWVQQLEPLGLPNSNNLDMGALDSIGNNATKIGDEVADVKASWGVDKVNLVTHSKGGLDARHYVENADDVEQVVQIGTPNAGSPLADKLQAGTLRLGLKGIVVNALVSVLAGPAGIQLTTPYMAIYNRRHGPNDNIRYTTMAGDYRADCAALDLFCRPIQRFLLSMSGSPGDTIVPVSSVHTLPYTSDRTFQSRGTNMEATHACLPTFSGCQLESLPIFNRLQDRVQAFGSAVVSAQQADITSTSSEGDSIGSGESQIQEIPIDQPGPVFFVMFYPDDRLGLDLELISPSGQVIDPQTAASDANMAHDQGDILGGLMTVYNIGNAETGTWIARVTASVSADASVEMPYLVSGWMEQSEITLQGSFETASIHSGEPLIINAAIADSGNPVADAQASAIIEQPDGSILSQMLNDDGIGADEVAGDGIYTGVFGDTAQAGMYRVAFEASRSGSASGPDFSREAFNIATVSESSSRFDGAFADFGLDSNGNGLFNQLVVEAGVNITDAGLYRIFGVLTDDNDNLHHANVVTELDAGPNTISLGFDGEALFRNGVDGPFRLKQLSLSEEHPDGLNIMPVDELIDAHSTGFYPFEAFEHAALLLPGTGTSVGVDTNGNGLFDRLDVTVDVRIEVAGFYQWSARLVDSNGTDLGLSSGSSSFSSGLQEMSFFFDGETIGSNGVNGPYHVTGLLLFGAGQSLVGGNVFTTDAFSASQFEGFVNDSDGDGIPDDQDACPLSDLSPTVVIDDCDTGVDNTLFADGCTIADLVGACAQDAKNHGAFSSCVARMTNELVSNGWLDNPDQGAIQSCAAQADIP